MASSNDLKIEGCDILKIEKLNENQIRCTLTSEDLESRQLKLSELAYGSEKAKSLFRELMLQAQTEYGFEAENMPIMIEAIPTAPDTIVLIVTKVENPEELDTRFSKFAPGSAEGLIPSSDSQEVPEASGADDILDLFKKLCDSAIKKATAKPKDKDEKVTEAGPVSDTPAVGKAPDLTRILTFATLDHVIAASKSLNGFYNGENTLYKNKTQQYVLILHQSGMVPEDFNKVCNILSEYGSGKACSPAGEAYLKEHGEVIIEKQALQQLLALA